MKYLLILPVIYYVLVDQKNPFICHVKYKREGVNEIKTESCLFSKTDTLKKRLEDETGEQIEIVGVKSLSGMP